MSRTITAIILVAMVLAVALILQYLRLDRKRFLAQLYYDGHVDDPVIDWLRCALELTDSAAVDGEARAELDALTAAYDAVKPARSWEKPTLVNRAHRLLELARRQSPAREDFLRAAEPMNALYAGFTSAAREFNILASGYNSALDTAVGNAVSALFRLKKLETLEDLEL